MKRSLIVAAILSAILLFVLPEKAKAEVNFSISFFSPPPVAATGGLVIIPNSYYDGEQVVRHHGHWYRPTPYGWLRARSFQGPWFYISFSDVPGRVVYLYPTKLHKHKRHVHKKRWKKRNKEWTRNDRYRRHRDHDGRYDRDDHVRRHRRGHVRPMIGSWYGYGR